jgi:hypothetical protein
MPRGQPKACAGLGKIEMRNSTEEMRLRKRRLMFSDLGLRLPLSDAGIAPGLNIGHWPFKNLKTRGNNKE